MVSPWLPNARHPACDSPRCVAPHTYFTRWSQSTSSSDAGQPDQRRAPRTPAGVRPVGSRRDQRPARTPHGLHQQEPQRRRPQRARCSRPRAGHHAREPAATWNRWTSGNMTSTSARSGSPSASASSTAATMITRGGRRRGGRVGGREHGGQQHEERADRGALLQRHDQDRGADTRITTRRSVGRAHPCRPPARPCFIAAAPDAARSTARDLAAAVAHGDHGTPWCSRARSRIRCSARSIETTAAPHGVVGSGTSSAGSRSTASTSLPRRASRTVSVDQLGRPGTGTAPRPSRPAAPARGSAPGHRCPRRRRAACTSWWRIRCSCRAPDPAARRRAGGRGRSARPGRRAAGRSRRAWLAARTPRSRLPPRRTSVPVGRGVPLADLAADVEPGVEREHQVGVGLGVPLADVQRAGRERAATRRGRAQRHPPVDAAQPVTRTGTGGCPAAPCRRQGGPTGARRRGPPRAAATGPAAAARSAAAPCGCAAMPDDRAVHVQPVVAREQVVRAQVDAVAPGVPLELGPHLAVGGGQQVHRTDARAWPAGACATR